MWITLWITLFNQRKKKRYTGSDFLENKNIAYIQVKEPALCLHPLIKFLNDKIHYEIDLHHLLLCQSQKDFKQQLKNLEDNVDGEFPSVIVHPEALNQEDLSTVQQLIFRLQNETQSNKSYIIISSLNPDVFGQKTPEKYETDQNEAINLKDLYNIDTYVCVSKEPGLLSKKYENDEKTRVIFIDTTYERLDPIPQNVERLCFVLSEQVFDTFSPFFDDIYMLLKFRCLFYSDYKDVYLSKVSEIYFEIPESDKIKPEKFPIPSTIIQPQIENEFNMDNLDIIINKAKETFNFPDDANLDFHYVLEQCVKVFFGKGNEKSDEENEVLAEMAKSEHTEENIYKFISDNINDSNDSTHLLFLIRCAIQVFVNLSGRNFFFYMKKNLMSDNVSDEYICYCGSPEWNDPNTNYVPKWYLENLKIKDDVNNFFQKSGKDKLFKIIYMSSSRQKVVNCSKNAKTPQN